MSSVPALRIQAVNDAPVEPNGDFVLYWMIANRRTQWNYSLDRAVEWCKELGKPLLILEAVRCDYPWASDRIHRFILQGMADNRRHLSGKSVQYYCYVETETAAGEGLVETLASRAAVVITDDFPCFFLPRMVTVVANRMSVKCEAVDSNGLLPMRAADRVFARAYDFRRWLHKNLAPFLEESPREDPLAGLELPLIEIPNEIRRRWPEASDELLAANPNVLSDLPVDHQVRPAAFDGGTATASQVLTRFFRDRLSRYADERNNAEDEAASGFSPFLHFGHLSAHEVFAALVQREEWTLANLAEKGKGSREGWWGMSREAESFLD